MHTNIFLCKSEISYQNTTIDSNLQSGAVVEGVVVLQVPSKINKKHTFQLGTGFSKEWKIASVSA